MYFMISLFINIADRERIEASACATVAVNDAGE